MVATRDLVTVDVVQNAVPSEGARVVPFNLDFSGVTSRTIDITQLINSGRFNTLQAIYFDNSGSGAALSVSFANSFQTVTVPPRSQGYIRCLSVNPPRMTFSSVGGGVIPVALLNFPVDTAVWSTVTSDVSNLVNLLSPVIVNNRMQTFPFYNGSGDVAVPPLVGTEAFSATLAAGNLSTVVIPAPGAGARWFVTGIHCTLAKSASLAVPAPVTFTLQSDGIDYFAETIDVNDVSTSLDEGNIRLFAGFGKGIWIAPAANQALSLVADTALATGDVNITILGGTTANVP